MDQQIHCIAQRLSHQASRLVGWLDGISHHGNSKRKIDFRENNICQKKSTETEENYAVVTGNSKRATQTNSPAQLTKSKHKARNEAKTGSNENNIGIVGVRHTQTPALLTAS